MKKRLLPCLTLALLLALALAGRAAARTVVTTTTNLPTIQISVPSTANVYINPNRLPVQLTASTETAQIISSPCYIENLSEVPVRVHVEATGSARGGISLVGETTAGSTSKAKRVFMYFEIQAGVDPDDVTWDNEYDADSHIVIRDGDTKTKNSMVILGSAEHEKRYGVFRLTGDCIEEPTEAWNSRDSVTVRIVFTFSPLPVDTEIP